MTKRKKKKKQVLPSIIRDFEVSKTYFAKYSEIARKTLRILDLEPELYDNFTKRQKIKMMQAKFAAPHIEIKKGHNVPRHFLKMIQRESHQFMKNSQVGEPEIDLYYFDYLTMGMSFITHVISDYQQNKESPQVETYLSIKNRAEEIDGNESNLMMGYLRFLHYMLYQISQINYRIYGFEFEWRELSYCFKIAAHITITAVECQRKYFSYHDKFRPAFRMAIGNYMSSEPIYLTVPCNKVIEGSNQTDLLNIYIQNHAISRLKERMDTYTHYERTLFLMLSVVNCETVHFSRERCVIKYKNTENQLLAYLPFSIIGNDIFILTILPLTSPSTPEGKSLCRALNITKEELSFFKMDKLSFFKNNDFENMPKLKKALTETGLLYLTELQYSDTIDIPQFEYSTGLIARYFQPERTHEEVLNEIDERY